MKWLIPLVAAVTVAGTGCRGDREKCEKAARNYHHLMFWETAEAEIAAAPPERRDALRKEKSVQFEQEENSPGVSQIVKGCMVENNKDTVNCLIDAKTAAQARKCAKQENNQAD